MGPGCVFTVCGVRENPEHPTEAGGGLGRRRGSRGGACPMSGAHPSGHPSQRRALRGCGEVGGWRPAPVEGSVQPGGLRGVWARAVGPRWGLTLSWLARW